jgi:excinuclease UvrABC nuclease subunit
MQVLRKRLDAAIATEAFEEAAKLRDQIRDLANTIAQEEEEAKANQGDATTKENTDSKDLAKEDQEGLDANEDESS